MIFKDVSNSYNGKMLRAFVHTSDTEVIETSLHYSPEYETKRNQYGVSWNERTGTHRLILHVSRMKKDGDFYSGGLGERYEMSKGHKRQTLKELQKIAERLTSADIIAVTNHEAEPTVIIGGVK